MQSAFDPSANHAISKAEAAKLVGAFRKAASPGAHQSTAFNRSAFESILAQPGCAGIRIYRAAHEDGTATMVLVGVDASGHDLAGQEALCAQNGTNCPPFCAPNDWL